MRQNQPKLGIFNVLNVWGVGILLGNVQIKKTMILKDGDFESESEKESDDEIPPLEDYSYVEYAKGDNLVVQRTLSVQNKIEDYGE